MANVIKFLVLVLLSGCGAPVDSAIFEDHALELPTSGAPSSAGSGGATAGSSGAPSSAGSGGATAGSSGAPSSAGSDGATAGSSGAPSSAGSGGATAGSSGAPSSAGSGGEGGEPSACEERELAAERGLCYEITGRLSPYSCEVPEAPRCFWLANEGLKPVFTLYGEYDSAYKMRVLSMSGGKCPTDCTRAGQ